MEEIFCHNFNAKWCFETYDLFTYILSHIYATKQCLFPVINLFDTLPSLPCLTMHKKYFLIFLCFTVINRPGVAGTVFTNSGATSQVSDYLTY